MQPKTFTDFLPPVTSTNGCWFHLDQVACKVLSCLNEASSAKTIAAPKSLAFF